MAPLLFISDVCHPFSSPFGLCMIQQHGTLPNFSLAWLSFLFNKLPHQSFYLRHGLSLNLRKFLNTLPHIHSDVVIQGSWSHPLSLEVTIGINLKFLSFIWIWYRSDFNFLHKAEMCKEKFPTVFYTFLLFDTNNMTNKSRELDTLESLIRFSVRWRRK